MRSESSLRITWHKPELTVEEWEFFSHPAKQNFYTQHSVTWDQLCTSFDYGILTPYPRSPLLNGYTVEGAYSSYDEYCVYLAKAKRGYRRSYSSMENSLQRDGSLLLPAPIIIRADSNQLLFSGYRRLCLAWNYGMTPYAWLVTLPERTPCT